MLQVGAGAGTFQHYDTFDQPENVVERLATVLLISHKKASDTEAFASPRFTHKETLHHVAQVRDVRLPGRDQPAARPDHQVSGTVCGRVVDFCFYVFYPPRPSTTTV